MSKKKKLYLYLTILLGTITASILEPVKSYQDDSFYYEDYEEAKTLCIFKNKLFKLVFD